MRMKHTGVVKGGKFVFDNILDYRKNILAFEGKRVYLTIEEDRPPRSNEANKYYWGVLLRIIADFTGHAPEEIHEYLKDELLPKKEIMGKDLASSTARLNTAQFEEYLQKGRDFALIRLGLHIPLPNEVEY